MTDIAHMCIEDVKAKIGTIALVTEKIFYVYSEDDLIQSAVHHKRPCVGLMYEGMRGLPSHERQGLLCELGVAVVVIAQTKDIANLDKKDSIVLLLDQIRGVIKEKKSPTGHFWKFMMESPVGDVSNNLLYIQRWSTVALITP